MPSSDLARNLAKIPSVNTILEALQDTVPPVQQKYVKQIAVVIIEEVRRNPGKYKLEKKSRQELGEEIITVVKEKIELLLSGSLGKVINATGVVLHTGMGRAPLDAALIGHLQEVSRYCNLEIRLDTGRRGQRNDHLSGLLQIITGAEDGLAVNNNAAAVMLMLNTVGKRREVIISRGEMIEIGGSFRMPEVMRLSGCKLCEVGTTNKTHLDDYERAITSKTGAILICHPSNYEVQGFTKKPSIGEIVAVGHKHQIPVIFDLGSGSLIDTSHFGSDSEPVVSEMVDKGLDLISFSGDKLLGGPQAGIIVGRKKWIERCKKNQLLRALRLDKFMIRLLQQVLTYYLYEDSVTNRLVSLKALTTPSSDLEKRCREFLESLPASIRDSASVVATRGKVGSGAYPIMELNSWAVTLKPAGMSANTLAGKLRNHKIPVFTYIENDRVFLDLRTVSDEESMLLKQALEEILT
jgi:L-seryl-tRNA(Ser) seleniumtransferase